MRPVASTRSLLFLGGFAASCPSSPGRLDPPAESTAIHVGAYVLAPASTFTFNSVRNTIAMVTDHPSACAQVSTLNACRPESWLANRRYIDSPHAVRTALVIYLADPRGATAPGTYPVSRACGGNVAPYSFGAFMVRDGSGQVIVRDEATRGSVLLWEVAPGRGAAGTYDLVLESGAVIEGAFSGPSCSQVDAFTDVPSASQTFGPASATESCACRGTTASSTCTRPPGAPWVCICADADRTSSCEVAADASFPACWERYFTCCPMCP